MLKICLFFAVVLVAWSSEESEDVIWSFKQAMHDCKIARKCRSSFFKSLMHRAPLSPCNYTDVTVATECLEDKLLGNKTMLKSRLAACCDMESEYRSTSVACTKSCVRALSSPSLGFGAPAPAKVRLDQMMQQCTTVDPAFGCLGNQLILLTYRNRK